MRRYKRLGNKYAELRKKVDNHNVETPYYVFYDLYREIVDAHYKKQISEYEYEFLVNILMAKRI